MTAYLLCLTALFAFAAGHAVASLYHTREWFYRWAAPMFALSALVTGLTALLTRP